MYEIFKKISESCNDDYWREFYDNCSKGIFPSDIQYINGNLNINIKKKWELYEIDHSNEENAINLIKKILEKFYSLIDRSIPRKSISTKKINKKINESMIFSYLKKLKEKYNFNSSTEDSLYSWLQILIFIKFLTNEDFIIENNEIIKIKGISYEKGKEFILEKEIPEMDIQIEKE